MTELNDNRAGLAAPRFAGPISLTGSHRWIANRTQAHRRYASRLTRRAQPSFVRHAGLPLAQRLLARMRYAESSREYATLPLVARIVRATPWESAEIVGPTAPALHEALARRSAQIGQQHRPAADVRPPNLLQRALERPAVRDVTHAARIPAHAASMAAWAFEAPLWPRYASHAGAMRVKDLQTHASLVERRRLPDSTGPFTATLRRLVSLTSTLPNWQYSRAGVKASTEAAIVRQLNLRFVQPAARLSGTQTEYRAAESQRQATNRSVQATQASMGARAVPRPNPLAPGIAVPLAQRIASTSRPLVAARFWQIARQHADPADGTLSSQVSWQQAADTVWAGTPVAAQARAARKSGPPVLVSRARLRPSTEREWQARALEPSQRPANMLPQKQADRTPAGRGLAAGAAQSHTHPLPGRASSQQPAGLPARVLRRLASTAGDRASDTPFGTAREPSLHPQWQPVMLHVLRRAESAPRSADFRLSVPWRGTAETDVRSATRDPLNQNTAQVERRLAPLPRAVSGTAALAQHLFVSRYLARAERPVWERATAAPYSALTSPTASLLRRLAQQVAQRADDQLTAGAPAQASRASVGRAAAVSSTEPRSQPGPWSLGAQRTEAPPRRAAPAPIGTSAQRPMHALHRLRLSAEPAGRASAAHPGERASGTRASGGGLTLLHRSLPAALRAQSDAGATSIPALAQRHSRLDARSHSDAAHHRPAPWQLPQGAEQPAPAGTSATLSAHMAELALTRIQRQLLAQQAPTDASATLSAHMAKLALTRIQRQLLAQQAPTDASATLLARTSAPASTRVHQRLLSQPAVDSAFAGGRARDGGRQSADGSNSWPLLADLSHIVRRFALSKRSALARTDASIHQTGASMVADQPRGAAESSRGASGGAYIPVIMRWLAGLAARGPAGSAESETAPLQASWSNRREHAAVNLQGSSTASGALHLLQPLRAPSASTLESTQPLATPGAIQRAGPGSDQDTDVAQSIEALAQQVYSRLRQRLLAEAERLGR